MPESRQPPTIVELSLALTQVGTIFSNFVTELKAVQASTPAMTATTSEGWTRSNGAMVWGAPQGHASRPPPPKTVAPEPGAVSRTASRAVRRVFGGSAELSDAAQAHWDQQGGKIEPRALWQAEGLTRGDKIRLGRQGFGAAMSDHTLSANQTRKEEWDKANLFEKGYIVQAAARTAGRMAQRVQSKNPMAVGSELGYSQEGGSLGPVQMPWAPVSTEAGRKGITEWAKRKWMAWKTPGLGTGDIGEIQGALYGRGWVEGDHRDALMDSLVNVKKRYKGMDSDRAAAMLDQGTRYGNAQVSEMERILKRIPDAARAAGLGMNAMIDAIDEVANASQKQGATYAQGAKFGATALAVTGRDPRLQQALSESSFVQSRVTALTGVLPQAQGALDPNERLLLNARSLREEFNMYRGMPGRKRTDVLDPSQSYTVTGDEQAIAMLAEKHPELGPDGIRAALKDEKRQALMNQLGESVHLSTQIGDRAGRRRDWQTAEDKLRNTTVLEQMRDKHVLKQSDIDKIKKEADSAVSKARGLDDPKARAEALRNASAAKEKAIADITKDSTKKAVKDSTPPEVKIALSGAAKHLFTLIGLDANGKLASKSVADAGGKALLNTDVGKVAKLTVQSIGGLLGAGD